MKKALSLFMILMILLGILNFNYVYASENETLADEISNIFLEEPVTINTRTVQSVVGYGAQIIGADGKIYCFGTDATIIYDVTNEEWSTAEAMPVGRTGFGLAEANGIIYVIGGGMEIDNDITKRVDTFNTTNNTWGTAADMPNSLTNVEATAVGGKIYCAGVRSSASWVEIVIYDTVSNSWSYADDDFLQNGYYTASAVGDKIYYTSKNLSQGNKTYELNTADLSWKECQPRPNYVIDDSSVGQYELATVDDILLCIEYGGDNDANSKVRYVYIPAEDSWVVLPDKLPDLEINDQAFTLYNDQIFVLTSDTYSDGLTKSRLAATYFLSDERMYSSGDTLAVGNKHILNYSNGVLLAKGDNTYGQLGDGTNNSSDLFVEVQTPWEENGETVRSIAAAGDMSYVITDKYNLYAWGRNGNSQLGNGSTSDLNTPALVAENVLKVAGGESHTIILKRDASVWTSGNNSYGQLGNNSTSTKRRFDRVAENAVDIEAGKYQSYIIDGAGTLKGCGNNAQGALGIGTSGSYYRVFTDIMTNVKSISSGYAHSVAVDDSGNMYVWGSNSYGQLGLPENITYQNVPYKITGVTNPSIAEAGGYTSIYVKNGQAYQTGYMGIENEYTFKAVNNVSDIAELDVEDIIVAKTDDGELYKWGVNTYSQGFEINTSKITDEPVVLSDLTVTDIDSKRTQTLAVDSDRKVLQWGTGYFGTGADYEETCSYPVNAKDENGEVLDGDLVERGKNHNMIVQLNEEHTDVFGWGSNSNFPMGRSSGENSDSPEGDYTGGKVRYPKLISAFSAKILEDEDGYDYEDHKLYAIAAGAEFTVGSFKELRYDSGSVIFDDYYVYAMGSGYTNNSSVTTDEVTLGKGKVEYLDAGYDFTVAIVDKEVVTWGENDCGQLGDDLSDDDVFYVFEGDGDEYFTEIKAGPYFCIGLTNKGAVYSWGKNSMGQLGLGYTSDKVEAPKKISGLSNVVSVGVGHDHAMAVKSDGTLWTWGNNSKNQLGRTLGATNRPGQVMGITNAKEVVGGYEYTTVVDNNNRVWTFGSNEYGALGVYRNEPMRMYNGVGEEQEDRSNSVSQNSDTVNYQISPAAIDAVPVSENTGKEEVNY